MVDLSYRLQDFGLQPHHSGQCARRAPLTLLQRVGADLEDLTRGGPDQAHPLNPTSGYVPAVGRPCDALQGEGNLAGGDQGSRVFIGCCELMD